MVSPSNLSESFFCPNAKACPGGNRKCKTDQREVFSALTNLFETVTVGGGFKHFFYNSPRSLEKKKKTSNLT